MYGSSAPQYIFAVRHGARLDAADSSWHLTSATPYDPPLTYGGWLQGRSLGQRIASILSSRSTYPAPSSSNLNEHKAKGTKTGPKQTRIIIHTSPFLRCIQTSISISAGISMYCGQQQDVSSEGVGLKQEYIKPLLRVDAWLGEWLTPDYFTEVPPPPEMALLAATSKADLMRPSSAHAIRPNSLTDSPQSPLSTLPTDFASSLPSVNQAYYTPPIPGYAISPNKPIPRGYVSHAKEYVSIDYPWDSTKLGRGGEYGEEWPTMHKRFRWGYKQMLRWYSTMSTKATSNKLVRVKPESPEHADIAGAAEGDSSNGVTLPENTGHDSSAMLQARDGDQVETVVILVTHGAGCNALIGAMTDKPVLMDIGIASMTMAERIDESGNATLPKPLLKTNHSSGVISQPPIESTELNVMYDVKLIASTDHLRRGSMASIMNSTAGNSPKLVGRGNNNPFPAPGGWSLASGGTSGLGSSLLPLTENGSEEAPSAPPRRSSVASTVSSTGLWSRPATAAGGYTGDVSPHISEGGLSRSYSGKTFIDVERVYRTREQKERSASVRLFSSSASGADAEQAAGSESDSGNEEHGTWAERKRRWTMDQANRRGAM